MADSKPWLLVKTNIPYSSLTPAHISLTTYGLDGVGAVSTLTVAWQWVNGELKGARGILLHNGSCGAKIFFVDMGGKVALMLSNVGETKAIVSHIRGVDEAELSKHWDVDYATDLEVGGYKRTPIVLNHVNLNSRAPSAIGLLQYTFAKEIPEGYLEFAGQPFDPLAYPELAKMYPDYKLPDLRDYFLKGGENVGAVYEDSVQPLTFEGIPLPPHSHSVVCYHIPPPSGRNSYVNYLYEGGAPQRDSSVETGGSTQGTIEGQGKETAPKHALVRYICEAG